MSGEAGNRKTPGRAGQASPPGVSSEPAWTLAEVAEMAGGELRRAGGRDAHAPRSPGPSGDPSGEPFGWSRIRLDSRAVRPGDFFVALRGERHDAHDFLSEVGASGARGALVDRPAQVPGFDQVVVEDSLRGWQRWGAAHRARRTDLPVLGMTGSSGKTTVKDLIAHLLAGLGPVHATSGNRNNHVGVPWTLLGIAPEHRFAVVEMGMNHAGEIALLSGLTRPTAALITDVGTAHIGHLGSREAILAAKLEILEGCSEGVPIVLPHDPWVLDRLPREVRRHPVTTFGLDSAADWHPVGSVEWSLSGTRFVTPLAGPIGTPLLGPGAVLSSLAALAAMSALGLDAAGLAPRLASAARRALRMEPRTIGGVQWVLDCYNASPESTRLALRFLTEVPHPGRRVLVLGELGELGGFGPGIHRDLGSRTSAFDLALFVGEGARAAEAVRREVAPSATAWVASAEDAAGWLGPRLRQGDLVLLKGARRVGLERILDVLYPESAGSRADRS